MESGISKRGFASMDPARQREIASRGGKVAHEKGTAHQFNSDEARAAGSKGGKAVSADSEYMSKIGTIGGRASAASRAAKKAVQQHSSSGPTA
jgi:general stress protein YciG